MPSTITSALTLMAQHLKWRTTRIILVDVHTVEFGYGLSTPLDQPLRSIEQLKTNNKDEESPPRTVIGLIPHRHVDQDTIQFLIKAGVDDIHTPAELKSAIPQLLQSQ